MNSSTESQKESIIPAKSFIAKSLFFFFYLIVTSMALNISGIPRILEFGFSFYQIMNVYLPLLLFILIVSFGFRLKSVLIFFIIQFLYLSFIFESVYSLSSVNPHGFEIFVFVALIIIMMSATVTFIWNSIYVREQFIFNIYTLFLSLLATYVYIVSGDLIIDIYVLIGEYIRAVADINIFFMDYAGFAVFFVCFITCVNYWLFTLLSTLPTIHKKVFHR